MEKSRPASFHAYCNDQAVRTAVDLLLAANPHGNSKPLNLPKDIEWNDLVAFHRAVLSAHEIRSAYAIYLIELWDAVWESTLVSVNIGANTLTPNECMDRLNVALDTYSTWESGEFYRSYEIKNSNYCLGLGTADDTKGPFLWFNFWEGENTNIELDYDDFWLRETKDSEGWVRTRESSLRVVENGSFDISRLIDAATTVLAQVRNHVRD